MSKIITILAVLLVTGCSNIRAVGDLEPLNDTAFEPVRESISVADKVLNMTGNYHDSPTAGQINRAAGHAERLNQTSIPSTVQQVNDLRKYADGYQGR